MSELGDMIIEEIRKVNAFKGKLAKATTLMSNIPVALSWQHDENEVMAARKLLTDCVQALQVLLDEEAISRFVMTAHINGAPYLERLRVSFPLIDKLLSEAQKDVPDEE